MTQLLVHFKGQIVGEERKTRFKAILKKNSKYDPAAKKMFPLQ